MIKINANWGINITEISVDLYRTVKRKGKIEWQPKYY